MSERGHEDHSPFILGDQIGYGAHAEVFRAKQDKHKIVKLLSIRTPNASAADDFPIQRYYTEAEFREHYQENLRMLQENLGQHLTRTQLVFGTDQRGGPQGWLITDEVIEDKSATEENKAQDLDDLLRDVVLMCQKQTGDEKMVPDIFGDDDIRFGYTMSNAMPKFYLLDIYPLMKINLSMIHRRISEVMTKHFPTYEFPKTNNALKKLGYNKTED